MNFLFQIFNYFPKQLKENKRKRFFLSLSLSLFLVGNNDASAKYKTIELFIFKTGPSNYLLSGDLYYYFYTPNGDVQFEK